jgi:hypothetical protein
MADPIDPTPTEDKIMENALAPKRASDPSGAMEQHPIADQIAAQDNQITRRNLKRRAFPVKLINVVPPGAVGDR